MLNRFLNGVALAVVLWFIAVVAAFPAAAQSNDLNVKLPYTVTVGAKTLPPGEYSIHTVETGIDSRILLFESDAGVTVAVPAMRITRAYSERHGKTEVVLERHGDTYRLDKVWIQDQLSGYRFLTPNL